jgi:hypothetical protein
VRWTKYFPSSPDPVAQQPLVGQGLLLLASRLHLGTPQSVGLLWTSDQPEPDNTQHAQEIDIHAPRGIRTRNPRQATDRRPTPYNARPLELAECANST